MQGRIYTSRSRHGVYVIYRLPFIRACIYTAHNDASAWWSAVLYIIHIQLNCDCMSARKKERAKKKDARRKVTLPIVSTYAGGVNYVPPYRVTLALWCAFQDHQHISYIALVHFIGTNCKFLQFLFFFSFLFLFIHPSIFFYLTSCEWGHDLTFNVIHLINWPWLSLLLFNFQDHYFPQISYIRYNMILRGCYILYVCI